MSNFKTTHTTPIPYITASNGELSTRSFNLFKKFDTDGNGVIDESELEELTIAIGYQTTKNEIKIL